MDAISALLPLSDWISIIQTAAIVITGIAAVATLRTNSKLSRHRATIELLLAQRTDERLFEAKQAMSDLHRNPDISITALACKGMESDANRQHVLTVLNNYEFIAVGIREKALDEYVYKRAQFSTVLRDWKATKAFIIELRNQNNIPTLFQEFEYLYNKWVASPLKKDNPH
ncbi:MAG: hypothetical protein RL217_64 [Pseudomonadota bacterium]|jgi:hypothetical protein